LKAHKESLLVTEITVDPWTPVSDGAQGSGMMRTTMYRYPLNVVGCPPSTMIREVQKVRFDEEGNIMMVDTSCQSLDVPYGTYFTIENRLKITAAPEGCRVDITMQTFFSRSTFMEWKINSNAIASTKESWEGWCAFIKTYIAPKSSKGGSTGRKRKDSSAAQEQNRAEHRAKMLKEKEEASGLELVLGAVALAAMASLCMLWAQYRIWSLEAVMADTNN